MGRLSLSFSDKITFYFLRDNCL